MKTFYLNSDRAYIEVGVFYIGWNNVPHHFSKGEDCGDETFGFAFRNFYVGCYSDRKWVAGFLDESGCLLQFGK